MTPSPTFDMARWTARTALVTGASSGIGAAIAQRLLREGMNVVGCGRGEDRVTAVLAEADPTGNQSLAVACDVRDEGQMKVMFARASERFGGEAGSTASRRP